MARKLSEYGLRPLYFATKNKTTNFDWRGLRYPRSLPRILGNLRYAWRTRRQRRQYGVSRVDAVGLYESLPDFLYNCLTILRHEARGVPGSFAKNLDVDQAYKHWMYAIDVQLKKLDTVRDMEESWEDDTLKLIHNSRESKRLLQEVFLWVSLHIHELGD